MNIDELTIAQVKEINSLMAGTAKPNRLTNHPLDGMKVVAVIPYGFVFFGKLETLEKGYMLTQASNIRRWEKRDGGLPEFAEKGPIEKDRIDKVGDIYLENVLFFYPAGF